MSSPRVLVTAAALLATAVLAQADVKVVVEHNDNEHTSPSFRFPTVPGLAHARQGSRAQLVLIDGQPDGNSGSLEALADGKLPHEADDPSENFFFGAGTDGGRVLIDLGEVLDISEVNTYSWHPGTRGPQVYSLYGMGTPGVDGNERPKRGTDPITVGWKVIARVDTRRPNENIGGQYVAHVFDSNGYLGRFRYLLLDMLRPKILTPLATPFTARSKSSTRRVPGSRERAMGQSAVTFSRWTEARIELRSIPARHGIWLSGLKMLSPRS